MSMCWYNANEKETSRYLVIFGQGDWILHFHCFYILGNLFFCKSCLVELKDVVGNKNQKENNFKWFGIFASQHFVLSFVV